jgi:16S rRNA (uracil1498-N3)-methyltransferase
VGVHAVRATPARPAVAGFQEIEKHLNLLLIMTRSTGGTTAPRLFIDADLHEGAAIAASPGQAHYLGTVLRRGVGDPVRLFNGRDGEWDAVLSAIRKDRATLTTAGRTRAQTIESGPWLVFALLKRDATDLVVRQAVELGCSRVLPVLTARTNAGHVNLERLRVIAVEAAEQSERLTVPPVDAPARLDAVLGAWPDDRRLFAALERTEADPIPAGPGQAGLLIGPEGGFTPEERAYLKKFPFVTGICLGPTILRAETAAAAGQAQLLAGGWAEYVGST